jgi:MFS family permease
MDIDSSPPKFTSDFRSMVRTLLFIGLAFFYLQFMVPIIADSVFIITPSELGIIFSVHTIGYMISSPLAGILTDRWNKKKLVLIGSIGRGIAYFVLYFAIYLESYYMFVAGSFTIGFSVSFFWVPFNALIGNKSHKNHRASAFGQRDFFLGISIFLGSFIGITYSGFIDELFPNSPLLTFFPLVLYGIANIVGGFVFQRKVDENLEIIALSSEENSQEVSQSSQSRKFIFGFIVLFIVLLLSSTNGSLSSPFIIKYVQDVFSADMLFTGLAYVPAGILNFILAPKLGKWVDKLSPKYTILVTASLGAFLTYALIQWGSLNILLFAVILVFDMTVATIAGLTVQNYLSRISKKHRGKIFGLNAFFANLGGVIGPILGGVAWQFYGMKAPFIISIFVELSLIPLYWIAVVSTQSSLEEQYTLDPSTDVPLS